MKIQDVIISNTYCHFCKKDFKDAVKLLGADVLEFHRDVHLKDVGSRSLGMGILNNRIANCTLCQLHETRNNTVPGSGNIIDPDLMFIGEAPGQDEDETGLPFVGRAGKLLTKIIKALGYERYEVFIANVLKCRPPNNRDPKPDEREQCFPFLKEQIAFVQPKVIITLGLPAAKVILSLSEDTKMGDVRGKLYKYKNIPVIPTYHPAYLLRNPSAKKTVWNDLQTALKLIKHDKGVLHEGNS